MSRARLLAWVLSGVVAGLSLAALAGAAPAFAAGTCDGCSPWWHLSSGSVPTNLRPATSEVQELHEASSGITVVAVEGKNVACMGSSSFCPLIYKLPDDTTAAQLQTSLEVPYGAGDVEVSETTAAGGGFLVTDAGRYEAPISVTGTGASAKVLALGGSGQLVMTASNLGDADINGAAAPVTITDTLPPGVDATAISGRAGGNDTIVGGGAYSGGGEGRGPVSCSLSSLSCTWAGPGSLYPYEQLEVVITVGVVAVNARSGADNEVSISGGEAPGMSVSQPVNINSESAHFGVENYDLEPENEGGSLDTQAGSHPFQLTTTLVVNSISEPDLVHGYETPDAAALTKDLRFKLPPGLVGNPTPFPQCTELEFSAIQRPINQCPPDTAVGTVTAAVHVPPSNEVVEPSVPLFNLTPAVGEPARYGFVVEGVPVIIDTSVRTGGDYGVTVSVKNISQEAAFFSSQVTFWGVPGDPRHDNSRGWNCIDGGKIGETTGLSPCAALEQLHPPPLLTLPTSCPVNPVTGEPVPLQTSVEADSWKQAGSFQSFPTSEPMEALDGCNGLSFSPSISVAPDGEAASTPAGLTVGVKVPQEISLNAEGLSESDVKSITVALPAGVQINPSGGNGLLACSDAQIGFTGYAELDPLGEPGVTTPQFTPTAPSCPDASKVATVNIRSPLLPEPLEGSVYLAAPQNFVGPPQENPFESLVAMYIVAEDPVAGVLVKLPVRVSPDPVTGQLTTTVQSPQLPFDNAELHFFGGERAPLSTPALCGTYTTRASLAPWSGNPAAGASSAFDVTSGPDETGLSGCSEPRQFAPGFQAGSTNLQAGAFTPFTTTMTRSDADQTLGRIEMQLPPGLSGTLSGVKLCGEAQANAGTCGQESLIGSTVVSAGLGSDPYTVTGGKVYITEGYGGGQFGLSIVNPAAAGPFVLDEGRPVVVRAAIFVDPHTAALRVVSDPLPTILDGIPLQIQHVNVTIERPGGQGFTFNPTNCAKTAIGATISSSQGANAGESTPFQVTNCATLKFEPKFAVSTSGKTSKADGASLNVKLTYPSTPQGTEANISKVKVDLPKQLPSRLTTLQKACLAAVFEANPAACPAASVVGHAKAITPILPVPLEGPAYFVSHGGEAFPSLIFVLQGYGVTEDLVATTFISKAGITSSTLKAVPDVPVGSFELNLPEEKYSALAANGNLCKSKLAMPTAFVGQNGAEIHESTPISVTGCKPELGIVRHSVKGTKATIVVSVPSAGKLLATGKGVSTGRGKARRAGDVSVKVTLTKAEQAFLRKHPDRKLRAKIKLRFTPRKGAKLTTSVTVLIA